MIFHGVNIGYSFFAQRVNEKHPIAKKYSKGNKNENPKTSKNENS